MAKNIIAKIKNRSDTSINWTNANPILEVGELGLETDTKQFKLGDGVTAWNNLAYTIENSNGNIDGGRADTVYGGMDSIDGGGA